MDGAWRRPPKSLADYGHTEPKRGAEWWGKSVLLTFALFKSEPPSGRNLKWPLPQEWICTRSNCVDCQAAFASKPAHIRIAGCQVDRRLLAGRLRRQASSHIWIAVRQLDQHRLSGRHGSKLPRHRGRSSHICFVLAVMVSSRHKKTPRTLRYAAFFTSTHR